MPAPTTVPEFLQLLRKSGLVPEKVLDDYVQRLPGDIPEGPNALQIGKVASAMTHNGLLSGFQASQLLEGKWRGFTIGKFKVVERLGSGGQGNVFLCEHLLTHQRMAVKVLRRVNADDPTSVKRFYREAQTAAALNHPNLVRAYDVGEDGTQHFLVMDYVDGCSLYDIIQRNGPLSVIRAIQYIRQAAQGLQYAHECGFVHRDIKPGNLLLDRNGTIKILDMGLARIFEEETDVLTRGQDVLGSADYLAPEQALDSHNVDIRADIYGLGSTFYYLLAGTPPFGDVRTVPQKLIAKQTRPPRCIRTLRPELPQSLANVIEKMVATDPNARFAAPIELVHALEPFVKTPAPASVSTEMGKQRLVRQGPGASPKLPKEPDDSGPVVPVRSGASDGRGADDTPSPFTSKTKAASSDPVPKLPAGSQAKSALPPAAPPRKFQEKDNKTPRRDTVHPLKPPRGNQPTKPASPPANRIMRKVWVATAMTVLLAAGVALGAILCLLFMKAGD